MFVTVQTITLVGALSASLFLSPLPLSPSVFWSKSLETAACFPCHVLCQAHAVQCIRANRTTAGSNDAMLIPSGCHCWCVIGPTPPGGGSVGGWNGGNSPCRLVFVNRSHLHLCCSLGQGWRAPVVVRVRQASLPGLYDGMRWAW